VLAAADDLEARFTALERELLQTRLSGRGQDALRWPARRAPSSSSVWPAA
jgi:hypothetical protein